MHVVVLDALGYMVAVSCCDKCAYVSSEKLLAKE